MIINKLSHAMRTDITARFGDGQAFTSFDFYQLCEKYGKPVKSATHVLRDMALKGLLECVGEQANKHGGGLTKRYAIIEGAQLTLKTVRDYQIEALQREQDMNRASLALQAALDKMTRNRGAPERERRHATGRLERRVRGQRYRTP